MFNMATNSVMDIVSNQPDGDKKSMKKELVINRNAAIVGGFLDLAIFTADVEHLKFVIEAGKSSVKYYDLLFGCLVATLSLQVFTAVLLCFSGYYCHTKNKCDQQRRRQLLTNFTMAVVVIISVLSIIITTFGTREGAK